MHRLSKPSASLLSTLSSPFLKALADPARQTIICVLVQNGGLDVTSISEYLTQERSVVSRHLKVLNEAGIVEGEKIGRQVIYRLRGENIVQHIEHLLNELKKTMATCCR
ncbi:MAG TPA: metalloregulator ArsR/SmtB family transcription factor [Noviherbaspirillum sp.]